jgi:hypothetical protein
MGAISQTFRLELLKQRAAGVRVYQIADAAQVRRSTLSGIVGGSIQVRPGDPRVLRVAAFLGLTPDECFDDEADRAVAS